MVPDQALAAIAAAVTTALTRERAPPGMWVTSHVTCARNVGFSS